MKIHLTSSKYISGILSKNLTSHFVGDNLVEIKLLLSTGAVRVDPCLLLFLVKKAFYRLFSLSSKERCKIETHNL